jgi:hypothetical protein
MHVHLNFKSFSGIVDSICSNYSFLCCNIEPESSLYHHFVFLSCLFKTSCHHAEKNWDVTYIGIFFVGVVVLGFECFLGKHSTTWPISPVLELVFKMLGTHHRWYRSITQCGSWCSQETAIWDVWGAADVTCIVFYNNFSFSTKV